LERGEIADLERPRRSACGVIVHLQHAFKWAIEDMFVTLVTPIDKSVSANACEATINCMVEVVQLTRDSISFNIPSTLPLVTTFKE
jgi:hypothetical protein